MKLVAHTPLRYSYAAVRDMLADNSSQKSGEPEGESPPQERSLTRGPAEVERVHSSSAVVPTGRIHWQTRSAEFGVT